MSERDLDARLDAVERALTDGDADLRELREAGAVTDDLQTLEERLDTVESRLDELEAGLEAVRGYAGNVRAVNREVERRASAALAKAETVEAAVDRGGSHRDRPDERAHDQAPDRTHRVDRPDGAHAKRTDRASTGSTGRRLDPSSTGRNEATSADRDPTGADAPDHRGGNRHTGRGRPDDPGGGTDRRNHDRANRDDDRSRRDGSPDSSQESDSDSDSGTEQFIERVRDAL
ncbi:hypothetical protein I7X12_04610 [Halosimplex litoreum]|uniref:DUF7310 domain-containing protein n=1 Tax=Halosimplex litoreum TaxID=1198301 RepID=A0A7T3G061_9EURY|nr:hypothetical protein [Halosimplex litoreum]QPV63918.1 hypothetical protein I7X12_04610 [Halosimplex litoreum]